MNKTPFITVMILCYNCGHLVEKALNAAAEQSFRDFDLLFIDNGSTDNSREVYRSFVRAHPDIHSGLVIVEHNQGPTHGWNEGLKQAAGEYVLFHDADDWMDSDCLSLLAEQAWSTGADRVTGQYREITPEGRVIRERKLVSRRSRRLATAMLQGTLFRRRVIVEHQLCFPESGNLVAYDFEMVFQFAACETNGGQIVQKTIYNYLVHSASVIQSSVSEGRETHYLETVTTPLITMTARVRAACPDAELGERMVYLLLRNYYPRVLALFQKTDGKTARALSRSMRACMEEHLPGYRKNRFLRPLWNGYEQPGSFAVWVLSRLESVGLLEPAAAFLALRLRGTKFFR